MLNLSVQQSYFDDRNNSCVAHERKKVQEHEGDFTYEMIKGHVKQSFSELLTWLSLKSGVYFH